MDYLSLKAAVVEAVQTLSVSKITDAWQAAKNEVVLVPRRGPGLLLSIDPGRPGPYLKDPGELSGRIPSPFSDLLRARIKGSSWASTNG